MATEKYEVRNRWTDKVQFTAEIECSPAATWRLKLGLAVLWAHKTGARLDGARLDGANLDGALVRGERVIRLLAIATRLDGYTFYAFEIAEGGVKINAGCRWFTPAEFRKHVARSYPGTKKADETLSIIAHIERMIEVLVVAPALQASDAP